MSVILHTCTAAGFLIYSVQVFVRTKRHAELEEQGVDMPEKPNVHFMKPQVAGGKCRCYSIRNFFVLGAEEAVLEFDHSFSSTFAKGSSKLLKDDPDVCGESWGNLLSWEEHAPDCKLVPTSFLLADGGEKPWRAS